MTDQTRIVQILGNCKQKHRSDMIVVSSKHAFPNPSTIHHIFIPIISLNLNYKFSPYEELWPSVKCPKSEEHNGYMHLVTDVLWTLSNFSDGKLYCREAFSVCRAHLRITEAKLAHREIVFWGAHS